VDKTLVVYIYQAMSISIQFKQMNLNAKGNYLK